MSDPDRALLQAIKNAQKVAASRGMELFGYAWTDGSLQAYFRPKGLSRRAKAMAALEAVEPPKPKPRRGFAQGRLL